MRRLVFFIVGLSFWLVIGGCRTQSVAPSFIAKDSIVHDSIVTTDTVYWIDPLFLNSLFECDSTGEIQRQKLANWSAKFDSLKKVSPIVRTVWKIKKETYEKEKIIAAPVKVIVEKVYFNTVTVILAIVCFILLFCLSLISYMFYRYTKNK